MIFFWRGPLNGFSFAVMLGCWVEVDKYFAFHAKPEMWGVSHGLLKLGY